VLAAASAWALPAVAVADPPISGVPGDAAVASTVAPLPPGENGYDDVLAAGNLLTDNAALGAAFADGATLTQKRHALADPDCRRALALIRNGVAKQMQPPGAFARDLVQFRQVGRLLTVEEYVLLADGRTAAAIDALRDDLYSADVLREESLVSALVANLTGTGGISELARHEAQWSSADCEHILQLVRDRMTDDHDYLSVSMEAGRREELLLVDGFAAEPWSSLYEFDSFIHPGSDLMQQARALGSDPAGQAAFWEQVRRKVADSFDQAESQDPFGGLKGAAVDAGSAPVLTVASVQSPKPIGTLVDAMVRSLGYPDVAALRRLVAGRERVPLLLLGADAAVRRYRWEVGRLPATLDDLKMPELTTDPYTGMPFAYVVTTDGSGYTLTCAAPPRADAKRGTVAPTRLPDVGVSWR
jgi:hypothetical protein